MLSAYFLINEGRQLVGNGLDYFSSFWNYTDLVPPILIIATLIIQLKTEEDIMSITFLGTMRSVASLFMWLKFLYFLRIFKETGKKFLYSFYNSVGYLIRMLTRVFWDIRIFTLIMLFMWIAFAEAFLRISEMSPEPFIINYFDALQYSYTLTLGAFNTTPYDSASQYVTLYLLMII